MQRTLLWTMALSGWAMLYVATYVAPPVHWPYYVRLYLGFY